MPKYTWTYIAKFDKQINITYNGAVTINNTTYQPNQIYFTSDNSSFQATAYPNYDNSMYNVLHRWKQGTTLLGTDNPHTFQPTDHTNYTIEHTPVKPTNNYRNLHFNDTVGAYVKVKWDGPPLDNSGIKKYAIYRKVRHNGVTGSEVLIGTVNATGASDYSFIDNDYIITSGYVDLLFYDVRAFYDPENDGTGTYSDPDFENLYGEFVLNQSDYKYELSLLKEIPDDYKIENYPNPFNPTTKITYQLPEKGNVVLKIYDALGKEIRTLVNSTKEAGYYSIDFDASDLPSGVYIYQIQAGKFNQSKKMLLVK